jgi:hypothetical protein
LSGWRAHQTEKQQPLVRPPTHRQNQKQPPGLRMKTPALRANLPMLNRANAKRSHTNWRCAIAQQPPCETAVDAETRTYTAEDGHRPNPDIPGQSGSIYQ